MKRTTRAHMLAVVVMLGIATTLMAIILPSNKLIEVMRALLLSASITATATWAGVAWAILKDREAEDGDELAMGVFLISGSTAGWACWYLVWRLLGEPKWWFTNYALSTLSLVSFIGFLNVLIATKRKGGRTPTVQWVGIGIKVGSGLAVVLVSLALFTWWLTE